MADALRPGDPGEPRVEVHDTVDETSAAAAGLIAGALRAAVEHRGRADWATTGGSTPVGIYRVLGTPPIRDDVPWDRVHVWWGDDRFVPRDHPSSNVLAVDQVLVRAAALAGQSGSGDDPIDVSARLEPGALIPAPNIHAMPMGPAINEARDTAWVAAAYEAELRAADLPIAPNGFPRLDVILVGMGPDGHVFSVFPGSTAFDGGAWVAPIPAPTQLEPRIARVSLHPAFLDAADLVIVVAHGVEKAEILGAVLGDARDPKKWPIQHARRSNAVWLLDATAAANLRR
jgi:6-phosphogluconolactonase